MILPQVNLEAAFQIKPEFLVAQIMNNHVYTIQKAVPPTNFTQKYHPIPPAVDFQRIISNVVKSLGTFLHQKFSHSSQVESLVDSKSQKIAEILRTQDYKALASDSFWYAICVIYKAGQFAQAQRQLLKRMSKNYINLLVSIDSKGSSNSLIYKKQTQLFLDYFYDILSQSIFYCFYYAYPKSRSQFDSRLKRKLIQMFSKLFNGLQISVSKLNWNLDLGTGNILNKLNQISSESPPLRRDVRKPLKLRCSPIMETYINNCRYKTVNFVRGFKLKLSRINKHQQLSNPQEMKYKAQLILSQVENIKKKSFSSKLLISSQLKQLKRQTKDQIARLQRKKRQQIKKGSEQYSNYLMSINSYCRNRSSTTNT